MLLFYRRKSVNYTTNYNLKKPTDSDMYDVADFSGNMDLIDEQLKTNADDITDVEKPTFEDYTNPETEVPDADTAMAAIKSKTSIGVLFQNIKAFFKGAITIGKLVDNCTSTSTDLGLTANQGKVLMDRILGVEEDVSELNAEAVGTITSTVGTLNQAYTRIVKKGSIVWLCLSIELNKDVEMYGNFAAIPEGFRPSGDFFTCATNHGEVIRVWITQGGVIANYSGGSLTSGDAWQIATCYFT